MSDSKNINTATVQPVPRRSADESRVSKEGCDRCFGCYNCFCNFIFSPYHGKNTWGQVLRLLSFVKSLDETILSMLEI
eukprot:1322870-Amorphochlora_amoeboformis.AAC.1